jgi:hypothetical protein
MQTAPSGTADLHGYAQWASPQKTLEQVGYGTPGQRSSFGDGIPLRDALPLILPHDWRVYAQPGVVGTIPVTWKAKNAQWTDTLKEVLRQSGLIATLNWPHMDLLLRVKPTPAVAPLNTKGYTAWVAPGTGSSSAASGIPSNFHVGPATSVSQQTFAAPSLSGATPVFTLNQGDLILTDLQKWAKQSGWTVVWQVPEDWQVPNTTTFNGDFQKAVSQVIQALSANGANVHAVFHTANNTVVISGAGGGE